MASGEYSEDIGNGGELVVACHGWLLKYYWPGPDMRYNGTFKNVPGREIDRYIKAWESNFQKFQELKKVLPKGGEYVEKSLMGMEIRVNTFLSEGVCLESYHCCVSDASKLRKMVASYEMAKEKAPVIQAMLAKLP